MILSSPCVLLCLTLWLFGKKLNLMHPEILFFGVLVVMVVV